MVSLGNSSDLDPVEMAPAQVREADDTVRLDLYSIILSTSLLILAILFGGGGCLTVLIAMTIHRLLRKLRYILIGILLVVCSVFDLIWCPIEIARLILHQQNSNGNIISVDVISDLKDVSSTFYVLLLCTLAAIITLICIQNLLKLVRKYENIPKVKLGVLFILVWLVISAALTLGYVLIILRDETDINPYHNLNKEAFHFKLAIQVLWIILVFIFVGIMVTFRLSTKLWKGHTNSETSDLHSNDNFTVPSLIIKSAEEMEEDEENEESSIALPSPDIQKDSTNESPVSRSSRSALKKRSASPSSQKVLFVSSPTREHSPKFGERLKSNHLEVNMAAILGRRRHTIAQISDPQLDMMQKAKTYNYVRKFSVDISALQAQLENPKVANSFPFHSQQDIKNAEKDDIEKKNHVFGSNSKCSRLSRDEMLTSQEIAEEPENELEYENEINESKSNNNTGEMNETQSIRSQSASVRSIHSARDSICPTPPMISLTQSDGEEKQLDVRSCENHLDDSYTSSKMASKLHKSCKLSCLLVITFVLSIFPMFMTEILWDCCLSDKTFINVNTCMIALSMVQTMIFPQIIFCVDANINKAVNSCFLNARLCILGFLHQKQPVPSNEEMSDTEV